MRLTSAIVGAMIVGGLLTSATGTAAQAKQESEALVTYNPAETNPAALAKAITEQSGVEAEVIKSKAPAEVSRAALKVDGLPRRGKHL